MKKYEELKENRELEQRASQLTFFNRRFVEDVKEYVKLVVESGDLDIYEYTRQDKTVYKFPVIGYIGKMGLENVWNDPFYTCCRYAIMEYATKEELEEGYSVLEELVDRICQGHKVIPKMPKEKQQKAYQALEMLTYIKDLILVGLELFKDMYKHLEADEGYMDIRHNETSWLWKKATMELQPA